jgi:predicted metal-binding transcription factor (methanogenesis marker protein 9)
VTTSFEEMDSTGMFGELMDDAAEKSKWNRDVALQLLEIAQSHDDYAEKLRHLAATLILEAQDFASETADLLAMEFPMSEVTTETPEELDEEN